MNLALRGISHNFGETNDSSFTNDLHKGLYFEDETIWLAQAQLVELYKTSKSNISEHIKHIFEEGEIIVSATVRNFRTVQIEGVREVSREQVYYNLVFAYFDIAEINAIEHKAMSMHMS